VTITCWLAALVVVLFGPAGPMLARATWVRRAPRAAVALWQAIGVAGALAAIGFGLSVAVLPARAGLAGGLTRMLAQGAAGHPLRGLGIAGALGLTLAVDVCTVLLIGLTVTAVRTTVDRSRHRRLLDLVGHAVDGSPGVQVIDDPRVAAWCLPGLRPRIVVSAGALDQLRHTEFGAVVAHERGHAHGRHGIVMLPFASMDTLLRRLPYARHARREVALLLEMAADDFALRTHRPRHLAAALIELASSGPAPTCSFAAGGTDVALRFHRILARNRTSVPVAAVVGAGVVAVLTLPMVALV